MPTNFISRTWGKLAQTRLSKHLIIPYSKLFSIATHEAEKQPAEYQTLNAFFTRRLRPGSRRVDPEPTAVVSPVDGRVSAFGKCRQDHLIQIKGIAFKLFGLLRDGPMAERFEQGSYATFYLSPRDYHRVHAPLDLEFYAMGYMPGNLLPVNLPSVQQIPGLYTQNERVMLYAKSPAGQLAMVLVGAHCVGSIRLDIDSFVTNRPGVGPMKMNFNPPIKVSKGKEVGVFEMGSTVLLLFTKNRVRLELPQPGEQIRMGERIGAFSVRKPRKTEGKKSPAVKQRAKPQQEET